jgi:5,10-methylenetetrahydrofolate reductase
MMTLLLHCFVAALCLHLQIGVETMMHLTCTNMPVEKLKEALDKVGAGK